MWEKVALSIGFMFVIGYVYYRLFLLILIKDMLIENCECCNIDKHNCYAQHVKEEDQV